MPKTEMIERDTLTPDEWIRFSQLEMVIHIGINDFLAVGGALLEVRDNKLYRKKHKTFVAYCKDRWGLTDEQARQLMSAPKNPIISKPLRQGG